MLNDAFMMKTMVTLPINTETNVICLEAHHDQVAAVRDVHRAARSV